MSTPLSDSELLIRTVAALTAIGMIAKGEGRIYQTSDEQLAEIAKRADAMRTQIRAAHEQRADEADAQAQSDAQATWADEGGAVQGDTK